MTREEIISGLTIELLEQEHLVNKSNDLVEDLVKDAISRQAIIDMTGLSKWFDSSDSYNEFVIALSELPPVTPIHKDRTIQDFVDKCRECGKQKMSNSEKSNKSKTVIYSGDGYADGYMVYDMAECPNCGYEYEEDDKDWGLPFCPNCGQSLNWESEE